MLSRDELIQCKLAIKSKFEITWWKVKSQLKPATIINFYTVKEHVIYRKDLHHGNDDDGENRDVDGDGDDDDDSDGDLLGNGWLRVMQAVHL